MLSFPSAFTTEKNKTTGLSPVWILKCPFPSTGTLYLSDYAFTVATWNGGITTKPWIGQWGSLVEDLAGGGLSASKVGGMKIDALIDPAASPNLDTILWTAANNVETTNIELYLWFRGLTPSTDPPQLLWTGNIIDFDRISELAYRLTLNDLSVKLDKQVGTVITETAYPDCHPDDVGRIEPIIYGAAKKVPALRTGWGATTTLVYGITAAQTTGITLSDSLGFPTSGTVLIDAEKIAYTSITSNVLGGVTRGASSTAATTHGQGALIWETKTQYDSLLAGHVLKSVDAIYARIAGRLLRVTSGASGLSSGGKHYVRSTSQLAVAVVSVDDQIAVSTGSHTHTASSGLNAVTPDEHLSRGGTWANWGGTSSGSALAIYTYDNQFPTGAKYFSGSGIRTEFRFARSIGFTPTRIRACANMQTTSGTATYTLGMAVNGQTTQTVSGSVGVAPSTTVRTPWVTMTAAATLNHANTYIEIYTGNYIWFSEFWVEIESANTINPSAATGVAKTGTVVPIGLQMVEQFYADVTGCADDGSGTYTGTPSALIQRPSHVIRHFLVTQGGMALADVDIASVGANDSAYAFALCIQEQKRLRAWVEAMAWQSRCWFRQAGKAILRWRASSPASQKTITNAMVRMNSDRSTGLVGPSRSPLDEVINKIDLRYKSDWSKSGLEALLAVVSASDATSITRYGEKSRPESMDMPFIQDATMAAAVRDFYLATYKDRKKYFTATLFLDNAELEFGDIVTLASAGNLVCEVVGLNVTPGSGRDGRIDSLTLDLREV